MGDDGYTIDGRKLTEELIEQYVAEAEAGYDLSEWKPVPGHPPRIPGEPITLSLDARLRAALDLRAAHENRLPEAILHAALIGYLAGWRRSDD